MNKESWALADIKATEYVSSNPGQYMQYLQDNYAITLLHKPDSDIINALSVIADEFGVIDIFDHSRKHIICAARQTACYILREYFAKTCRETMQILGYTNHTTIVDNTQRFKQFYNQKDPLIYETYQRIANRLNF